MLKFMDSFDHYSTFDLTKWTGGLGSYSTQCFISQGTGRYLNSLKILNPFAATTISSSIFKTLDNQATWIVGFAFKFTFLPTSTVPIVSIYDNGTTQCDVSLNSDGTLSVTRNATKLTNANNSTDHSTNTLSINTWYYIEFMVTIASSISSNTCKVNVNGTNTNWINLTSAQSTKNTSNATANQIVLGQAGNSWQSSPNTPTIEYDDLYICDSTGSTNNAFLGDTRIEALFPNANSGTNTSWTASVGSAFTCINEPYPNGDLNYIYSFSTNQISTFPCTNLSNTPTTIFGIQVTHCSRKTDAGTRQIADELRSGSTNFAGTTINLANSYIYYSTIYETDPNTSSAWTGTNVNALEIGVKEIT